MKKIIFIILFMLPAVLLAQVIPDPPTDWSDIIMNPQQWFVDFGAIAVLTAFIASFFNGLLKVVKKLPRQLVSWAVAIILLVGSDVFNFGYAKDFPILLAVIHGFGAGLASNGIFNIPTVKAVLTWVEGLFKKE